MPCEPGSDDLNGAIDVAAVQPIGQLALRELDGATVAALLGLLAIRVRREETLLERHFGAAYRAYRARSHHRSLREEGIVIADSEFVAEREGVCRIWAETFRDGPGSGV